MEDAQGSLVGSTDKWGASAGSAAYSDFGMPLSTPQFLMTGSPGHASQERDRTAARGLL